MRTKRNTKSLKEASKEVISHIENSGKKETMLLPSGCLLFNLACSGKPHGFLKVGTIMNLIGDSDAGKTFLAMTILASCFYKFGDAFRYFYFDYERAVSFSVKTLFGKPFAKALAYRPIPAGPKATIEKWHDMIEEICMEKNAPPAIIVTDSFDALTTLAELKSLKKQAKAKEGEAVGSYGTSKAKAASNFLGKIQQMIADTQSTVIIISQVRDNLAPFTFDKKTRSGGKALRFYSSLETWLVKVGKIGANKERPIGGITQANVKRSRMTGKQRRCEFPILYAYGVDDTRASLMFLADEGGATEVKGVYSIPELGIKGKMRSCIEQIEASPDLVKQLHKLTVDTWNDIEEKIKMEAVGNRRPKFG